jgi:hypothetical protein
MCRGWCPVVVRRQVRPGWDVGIHLGCDIEEGAAGEGGCEASKDGGNALVLWINLIQHTSIER